jgi:hypothetical protein
MFGKLRPKLIHEIGPSWNESVKAEIEELVKQENVTHFKVFMAYKVRIRRKVFFRGGWVCTLA